MNGRPVHGAAAPSTGPCTILKAKCVGNIFELDFLNGHLKTNCDVGNIFELDFFYGHFKTKCVGNIFELDFFNGHLKTKCVGNIFELDFLTVT